MAKKSKLRNAAVKIGTAAGTIDAKAHKAARKAALAAQVTKRELVELSRQVDALKKQLKKSIQRLQGALK